MKVLWESILGINDMNILFFNDYFSNNLTNIAYQLVYCVKLLIPQVEWVYTKVF